MQQSTTLTLTAWLLVGNHIMALSGSQACCLINIDFRNPSPPRLEPVEKSSNNSEEEPGPSWLQTMNHSWHNFKQGLPGPIPNNDSSKWLEDLTIAVNIALEFRGSDVHQQKKNVLAIWL